VKNHKLDKKKPVKVTFIPSISALEIRIEDQGHGFDLDSIPDPNLPENLLKPCGRGVHFMKQVMDTVVIEHGKTGSVLVLTKHRRREEVAEAESI
jgi:serine/threonine-protein kinase RsbW